MTSTEVDTRASLAQYSFDDLDQLDTISVIQGLDVAVKEDLIGKAFIVTKITVNEGSFGPFVSLEYVTRDNHAGVLNDGSSGIMAQCVAYIDAKGLSTGDGKTYDLVDAGMPLKSSRGLRKSDYEYTDDKGKVIPASTFYMS